jgi:2-dehydropantoate 2-reductase
MRLVVYGAGGIGGVLGARLFEHGHDVVLIARGPHGEAIRERGLVVESPPDTTVTLRIDTVARPDEVAWKDGDVVLLTMKSQDTSDALDALVDLVGRETPVVCVQNGVANERAALRQFANVYGVCVMCPTTYLEPGVVQANSTPTTGIMDIGRYPSGVDDVAADIAAAFSASTYLSDARPDIMRSKYQKLLMNLGNSIEAICGPSARGGELSDAAKAEGVSVLTAASIDFASDEEDAARRGDHLRLRPFVGQRRGGGSTWQSFARGSRAIETDFLNGEIVLLGREHGVPTPVNALLQVLTRERVLAGAAPGSMSVDEVFARLERE